MGGVGLSWILVDGRSWIRWMERKGYGRIWKVGREGDGFYGWISRGVLFIFKVD